MLLPLSGLQHLLFCERQCALIHVEREWAENRLTAEGQVLHKKANDPGQHCAASGVRVERSLALISHELGLSGLADTVEFHEDGTIFPVEYKRGRPKKGDEDRVQLCAQALCLEEMLEIEIPEGALFYGEKRRRTDVSFTPELRATVRQAAARFHELIATHHTPTAKREKKCDSCSLLSICLPDALRFKTGTQAWLDRQYV